MNFLNLEGLKLVLSSLLSKISVAFDALEARVTSAESNKVNKSGDTMTGSLDMGSNEVKNVKELKGNKITTTSTSETDPNVKVESLKVRDDRVDILKKTTTADDGSTSASSAAYFKNGYMEVNGGFKAKGDINTAASVNADGGVTASEDIQTTNGEFIGKGANVRNGSGGYYIFDDLNGSLLMFLSKVRLSFYTGDGGHRKIGLFDLANNFIRGVDISDDIDSCITIGDFSSNNPCYFEFNPYSRSRFNSKNGGFGIVLGGKTLAELDKDIFKFRVSSSCNFTGDVTNNEFKMIGNYCFKDVADHVTALPSGTTDEEKTWLENYLHNLFLDLKRSKLDEANAATEDELNALIANTYDGSLEQRNTLIASSGGLAEVVNVGDDANIYICNNGDAYMAGSGATNDFPWSELPFENNEAIKVLYILNGITTIGDNIFPYSSVLTKVYMSDTVTSLGESAFEACTSLTNIYLSKELKNIGTNAFKDCESIENIVMPDSVISLGEWSAFESCASLKNIILSNALTNIPDDTFAECANLTSITIPSSVTSIGSSAFSKCTGLTSITIPSSVTSIGSNAFWGCDNLTAITINKAQGSITGQPWGATGAEVIWTGGE